MFLDKYSKIIEKIEYYSNETLNSMIKNYENVILKDFYKDIVSVMGAGKKLRPLSMIFAFNGIKNEINEEIIKVSVSCELVHNASLILDDAMDEDVMRRGKKTFNSIYADKFLRSVGFNFSSYESGQSWIEKDSILGIIEMQRNISRFSYALSVLASNVLYELSEEVLNSQFPKKLRIKVLEQHRKMYLRLNEGQLLDILMEKRKMSEKEYFKMIDEKTGILFLYPMRIGLIFAGAENYKIMDEYSLDMARAFQIHDDILGSFGKSKHTGKPNDSDIKSGKNTLLAIKTREYAKEQRKEKFKKVFGNRSATDKEINEVRNIIKKTGAYKYCRTKEKELIKEAKNSIPEDLNKESRKFFENFADFAINRKF
ncbi:MAG: polyprenyl synthetase family protein [Methanomicrobia archaeon]|nr:polyprenyl synthetase family protein [Methanomicrobia archaeon]